jgi:RNA polymerase sigma factor (sigma-70 family)
MLRKLFKKKQIDNGNTTKLLYEMFYSHVYKIAYFITKDPHAAQDVLQETFIKVFKNIEKVEDGEKMRAWVSTIASRTAIDYIRKQKNGNEIEVEDVNNVEVNLNELSFTVEEEVERSFQRKSVREQIQKLPPNYRTIIYLKYIEGLKDQEIANVLDLNVATVKTRIHRAKSKLKKQLLEKSMMDGEIS